MWYNVKQSFSLFSHILYASAEQNFIQELKGEGKLSIFLFASADSIIYSQQT